MDCVDQAIAQANNGLNRVRIFRRGRKLTLRGSLSKKPGQGQGNRRSAPPIAESLGGGEAMSDQGEQLINP